MASWLTAAAFFLCLIGSTAFDIRKIYGDVTCDVLKSAYKGQWYEPKCEDDGVTFKSPQCFTLGLTICCCINNQPLKQSTSWLGECRAVTAGAKFPPCREGKFQEKSDDKKGGVFSGNELIY